VHQHTRQWVLDVPVAGRVEVSSQAPIHLPEPACPGPMLVEATESANRLILSADMCQHARCLDMPVIQRR
jgi:hypothetical protein